MQSLNNRVAVVTGASSGIGFAIAADFLKRGMRVVIASQNEQRLLAAEKALSANCKDPGMIYPVVTDIGNREDIENLAQKALERFGAVHVLVNNAGVYVPGYCWEISDEDWEWVVNVNLWGTVNSIKAFMPILLQQDEAHVVNVSSTGGLMTSPTHGPYTATKHAIVGISKALRTELQMKEANIGVTLVCPGAVATNITTQVATTGPDGKPRKPYTLSPEVQELWNTIDDFTDAGIPAAEVGPMVSDAILDNQFWLLPNGEVFFDVFDQELAGIKAQT